MRKLAIEPLNGFYDIKKLYADLMSCSKQEQQNQVWVFAFILYRHSDLSLARILADEHCLNAFNQISGDKLCVYSLEESVKLPRIAQSSHTVSSQPSSQSSSSFTTQMMFTIQYPKLENIVSPDKITDAIFTEDILNEKLTYPSILFFEVENERISDSVLYPLREEKQNELEKEIMGCFKRVDSYLKEHKEGEELSAIFDDIKERIKSDRAKQAVFHGVKKIVKTVSPSVICFALKPFIS